ncbi:hypothetical protein V501_07236 [Pseudogymnoascus sp. VKM F-4519 (FW-2642)]|nr:hypothetical protein V501_07236 [Pseudogymnoascus sp. VKM F-4519 (FW-2642)]
MAATARIRPYKDFLTPALHRRFTRAAATLLAVCYAESLLLGEWNSFLWSWFPLGRSGFRTGLLFISAFSIFVLRVAQLHVGQRTSSSGIATFREYAFRYQTIQTTGWYLFSAWIFSEVFIYSAPKSASILWITEGKNNERSRLNERPIYIMAFFLVLAVVQSAIHLAYDYDRVDLPAIKTAKKDSAAKPEQGSTESVAPSTKIRDSLPGIVAKSFGRVLIMTILMPFVYSIFIRHTAWKYTLGFAKIFWNLPKTTSLPTVSPFHWTVLGRTLYGGVLLVLLWEIGNRVFSTYVAEGPLKNERPITYESKDPNGSLLTGLKGKKLQTRAFAFWELVLIAERYQGRRKVIFEDIDRKGGSAWSQILTACTETITSMDTRVQTLDPASAPTEHIDIKPSRTPQIVSMLNGSDKPAKPEEPIPTLPRLTGDIQKENIWNAPPQPKTTAERIAKSSAALASEYGNTPTSPISVDGRRLLTQATSKVLTPEQQQALTPQGIWVALSPYVTQFLQSPLGWPFRQEFRRRIAAVVLGQPYGDAGIILDSIEALNLFAVASLKEDIYGNVQKDVPDIIRMLTKSLVSLEAMRKSFGVHWTDVSGDIESPEVDLVVGGLRGALQDIIGAFGEYFDDMKMNRADVRAAKEAAKAPEPQRPAEMQEARKRK